MHNFHNLKGKIRKKIRIWMKKIGFCFRKKKEGKELRETKIPTPILYIWKKSSYTGLQMNFREDKKWQNINY